MATDIEFENLIVSLQKKIDEGDIASIKLMADALYQGPSGKEKNIEKAFPYWKMAVDAGFKSLAAKVGFALYNGDGCEKNIELGIQYIKAGADAGDANAQFFMAYRYEQGLGDSENPTMAKKLYRSAALQNHPQAQYRLGMLQLIDGNTEGWHWLTCAHLNSVQDATDELNDFIRRNGKEGRETVEWQIGQIQKYGINPNAYLESKSSTSSSSGSNGGCYIATAVYGSYNCPQVWVLRRYRDYILSKTQTGRLFINIYYMVSPIMVKLFGEKSWFKLFWKKHLDKMIDRLKFSGISDLPYDDLR